MPMPGQVGLPEMAARHGLRPRSGHIEALQTAQADVRRSCLSSPVCQSLVPRSRPASGSRLPSDCGSPAMAPPEGRMMAMEDRSKQDVFRVDYG